MGHACRLFSGLHRITFNTMTNIFTIVNYDRSRFGALADRFRAGDHKFVNADVKRLKTLLEVIEFCFYVVDGLPTTKPSTLHGSDPKLETMPVPPPKSDLLKTMTPPEGTQSSYPPMLPKWYNVTNIVKSNKVLYACFRSHTMSQVLVPLAHTIDGNYLVIALFSLW